MTQECKYNVENQGDKWQLHHSQILKSYQESNNKTILAWMLSCNLQEASIFLYNRKLHFLLYKNLRRKILMKHYFFQIKFLAKIFRYFAIVPSVKSGMKFIKGRFKGIDIDRINRTSGVQGMVGTVEMIRILEV